MWFQNVSKEKIIKSAVLHSWLIAIATEMSKPVKPFFDMALSACTVVFPFSFSSDCYV